MEFKTYNIKANKIIAEDGSISEFYTRGAILLPADAERAKTYQKMAPFANKILNADGSVTEIAFGSGDGGTETDPIYVSERLLLALKTTRSGNTIMFNNADVTSETIDTDRIYFQGTNLIEVITDNNNMLIKKNGTNIFIFGESGAYFLNTTPDKKFLIQRDLLDYYYENTTVTTAVTLTNTFQNITSIVLPGAVSAFGRASAFVSRNSSGGTAIGLLTIRVTDGTNSYEQAHEIFRDLNTHKPFISAKKLNLSGTINVEMKYTDLAGTGAGPGTVTVNNIEASLSEI